MADNHVLAPTLSDFVYWYIMSQCNLRMYVIISLLRINGFCLLTKEDGSIVKEMNFLCGFVIVAILGNQLSANSLAYLASLQSCAPKLYANIPLQWRL